MTVVTAALAWFDEEPTDLHRFVRALPGAVDRLVAVDGAYARYPHQSFLSEPSEAAALRDASSDVGLPLELHLPERVWRSQVEKRTFLTQAAARGSDWVFTLDADHILHGVREAFRQELETVRADRVELDFYTTINPDRPLEETSSTSWHSELAGETRRMGLLLRALPGMRYERFHWYVSARKDGRRVWLYGGDDTYPKVRPHQLAAPFFIEHRCHFRRDRNILANRSFCEERAQRVAATGTEEIAA